jgi:hypothetical protein
MSKRNKKKLKKILQAQMMQKEKQEKKENPQPLEVGAVAEQPKNLIAQEVPGVGREIRKILITVLLLIVVVVVIYFINIKTDLILKAGNYLTKVLNINI